MSSLFLLPRNRDRIFRAIVNTEPANLIGYWPLDETSGTVARDYSGRGNHGVHVGVTLGQPGPDGRTCPLYDGSTDYTNVYSAALAAAFNGAEGTLLIWAKVANAGVWTDGLVHQMITIRADVNNYVYVRKEDPSTLFLRYTSGGAAKVLQRAAYTNTGFFCLGATWSAAADALRFFLDGIQQGVTDNALGAWSGSGLSATETVIGARSTAPLTPWPGTGAQCALWSKALTVAQLRPASVV